MLRVEARLVQGRERSSPRFFWGGIGTMIVMKFGGTSLAGAAQMRQVGSIVRRFARSKPVVVVSAMAGVTDDLIALAETSVAGPPRDVSARLHRPPRRDPPEARPRGVRRGARGRLGR